MSGKASEAASPARSPSPSSSSSSGVSSEIEIEFSRDPIEHLLGVLDARAEGSSYRKAILDLGATTLIEFLEMTDRDFTLCSDLTTAQAKNLIAIRDWATINGCFDPDSFAQLTADALREFRTHRIASRLAITPASAPVNANKSVALPAATAAQVPTPAPGPSPSDTSDSVPSPAASIAGPILAPVVSTATNSSMAALDSFKKGIKRDATAYPKFQDKKHFAFWDRQFRAIASLLNLPIQLTPLWCIALSY